MTFLQKFAWAIGVFALLGADRVASQSADLEAHGIMAEIVEALAVVLPLSLADDRFADPRQRAAIEGALEKLAQSAKRLEAHGSNLDASSGYLSRNLARDSLDIQTRFAQGRVSEARFLLHHLTDTCVGCHSRLPDDRPHTLGKRLLENAHIAHLPLDERAQLQAATRQFEPARESYESFFADPSTSLVDLDLTGHFEAYLELCLRVQNDPQRAIAHFQKLQNRADLPERIRHHVVSWIASLRALPTQANGDSLERSRALIRSTPPTLRFTDAAAIVPLIAASGALHRYVASSSEPSAELGEAYYLLGVIESRVGRSIFASQTEHLLETAIRMGPTEAYAGEAFDLLEEYLVSGYTGSAGTHVPPDVRRRLDDLHQLIVRANRAQGI
jgi:tetratricopeptide (TPR) repeat protein